MQVHRVERQFGNKTLILETGKLAKQAHGAVVVTMGETMVLVTAVEGNVIVGRDFFPLSVEYREKVYSAGKFPGGFIKREGRPSLKETLTSRLIDRPLRPLFPAHYINEVQVMASVLSADKEYDPDVLAMIGASAALAISQMPFQGPTGSVRVGRVDGQFVAFPTYQEEEKSELDLVVAGKEDGVAMIEGFSKELPEAQMGDAIMFAHGVCLEVAELIRELQAKAGKEKTAYVESPHNPLIAEFKKEYYDEFKKLKQTAGKQARAEAVATLKAKIIADFPVPEGAPYTAAQVAAAISQLEERIVRDLALEGTRADGRSQRQIRELHCEVGLLPRTHGSAIFQRGETQALITTTLGTASDEQRIEGLAEEYKKKFMLDYNFPPFSVGEVKPIRSPGRREMGHGALAERSLQAVMPQTDKFPYTVRLVSDILESNGSSSMATVCGSTLALMDAGVPITDPVAGISIGLVKEESNYVLLTDIMGDEDHYGDMDFKIAGTGRGVTGIQLDLKITAINEDIIRKTLQQARDARLEILRTMLSTLRAPRGEISKNAPRLITVKINPEKIGLLIGPGGKNIKAIQESTGTKVDIAEDGTVYISSVSADGAEMARNKIEAMIEDIKVGRVYEGKVSSIKDFGAFIEIAPGRDGLCHISELAEGFVSRVEDVVKVGDIVKVKVIAIDNQDRVKLSRKILLQEEAGVTGGGEGSGSLPPPPPGQEQPPPEGEYFEQRPPQREYREQREGGYGGGGGEQRGGYRDRGGYGGGGEQRGGYRDRGGDRGGYRGGDRGGDRGGYGGGYRGDRGGRGRGQGDQGGGGGYGRPPRQDYY